MRFFFYDFFAHLQHPSHMYWFRLFLLSFFYVDASTIATVIHQSFWHRPAGCAKIHWHTLFNQKNKNKKANKPWRETVSRASECLPNRTYPIPQRRLKRAHYPLFKFIFPSQRSWSSKKKGLAPPPLSEQRGVSNVCFTGLFLCRPTANVRSSWGFQEQNGNCVCFYFDVHLF